MLKRLTSKLVDVQGQRHRGSSTNDPRLRQRPKDFTPRNARLKPPPEGGDNDGGVNQSSTSEPRPPRRRNPGAAPSFSSVADAADNPAHRQLPPASQPRRKKPHNPPTTDSAIPSNAPTSKGPAPGNKPQGGGNRRSRFGAGLTQPEATSSSTTPSSSNKRKGPAVSSNHTGDDLTSTLIRGLTSAPYHDCPICFSSIRPDQAIWSCSPSIPLIHSPQQGPLQYCWTSFHVKCIRSWADKSVKDVAEAWRARGEPGKKGDWRCPGCQAKREIVPTGYWYSSCY